MNEGRDLSLLASAGVSFQKDKLRFVPRTRASVQGYQPAHFAHDRHADCSKTGRHAPFTVFLDFPSTFR